MDASALAGKSVVVFETLYFDSKEVASHTDINDEGQTVEFDGPEIKTKATVGGEKEVDPLETITLTDTGPGIPDIEKAMQAGFTTAADSVRDLGFGAGMGLPNMKKYSDEMTVESTVGVGTTVTMVVRSE